MESGETGYQKSGDKFCGLNFGEPVTNLEDYLFQLSLEAKATLMSLFGGNERLMGIELYDLSYLNGGQAACWVMEVDAYGIRGKYFMRARLKNSRGGLSDEKYFEKEVKVANKCTDIEGIPKIVGQYPGVLVYELLDGRALDKVLVEADLEEVEQLSILVNLVEILVNMHERGCVHRDIKPANVVVTKLGEVGIVDFGSARDELEGEKLDENGKTVDMSVLYTAPEIPFHKKYDQRSDIFSLGVLGFVLFDDWPSVEIRDKESWFYLMGRMKDLGEYRVFDECRLPRDVRRVLRKAISYDPDERYQSMLEFKEELVRLLELRVRAGEVEGIRNRISLMVEGVGD